MPFGQIAVTRSKRKSRDIQSGNLDLDSFRRMGVCVCVFVRGHPFWGGVQPKGQGLF